MKQSSVDLTRDTIKNLEASNRKLREQIRLLRNDLAAQAIRLKDSEVRFRSILENTSIPLFTFNAEGKILIWNKALEELLGMSGEDIKETNLLSAITKRNEIQRIEGIIETVFNGKGVTDIEGEITTASEKVRHLSISMLPVRGTASTVTFGSAIVVDITEKKQLEQALLQTEKMAAMGTLASGLAHEVGTPMNVILGRAESLLLHTNEEKTAKGLMIIIEQIDRMTRLIQHLLAFAREEPIEKKRLRINQIIKKGVEFIEQQAAAKGISLVTDLDPDLPTVLVDGDQILQVLINLFLNAIDAIQKGGEIRVSTHLIQTERRGQPRPGEAASGSRVVQILLKDTGSGIDPAHLNKIFDPFFTTKPVGKGTGLGLSVASSTIRNHGGQIMVASSVGHGTTFSIRLPAG